MRLIGYSKPEFRMRRGRVRVPPTARRPAARRYGRRAARRDIDLDAHELAAQTVDDRGDKRGKHSVSLANASWRRVDRCLPDALPAHYHHSATNS